MMRQDLIYHHSFIKMKAINNKKYLHFFMNFAFKMRKIKTITRKSIVNNSKKWKFPN